MTDQATIAAADRASRYWDFAEPGRIRRGSPAQRTMFSRMLIETFNPYKPSVIAWPVLDAAARQRLTGLPIWDIAVQTEGRARLRMLSFARTVADPLVREALELNGWEEGRHKEVLARLVAFYGIQLAPEPDYLEPTDPEWSYLITAYGECIDSFFAFGLFESARRSGYFPPELVETFEPVMQEEARHILFFVNWVKYRRSRLPWWGRPAFRLRCAWIILKQVASRVKTARSMGQPQTAGAGSVENFTLTAHQELGAEVSLHRLLELCLAENQRRMAEYDARLRRPRLVPGIARVLFRLVPSSM